MRSISLALAVSLLPTLAMAQPAGPAAGAVTQWFSADPSLGCVGARGQALACTTANEPHVEIYYGNAAGGSGQPDAVALINYLGDPTGNAMGFVIAYFRLQGSAYRFTRRLPEAEGIGAVPGSAVRFEGGKATIALTVLKKTDPRCCPSGRRVVTYQLR